MEDKAFIVDRLYKRDTERLELIQQQHKLKDEVSASNEQIDYFCNIFKEKSDTIESALTMVAMVQSSQLVSHFDSIRSDLRELQKYLAASSMFLKDFNLRKSQEVIQDLQTRSTELENLYFPKKKFGFRNKKTMKKACEMDEVDNCVKEVSSDKIVDKKVWNAVTCGFHNLSNQKLSMESENVYRKDVSLSFLKGCVIIMEGSPATLHLDHLTDCVILCGPVSTSVFVDKCTNCKMALACQQLRFHSSSSCDVYLHVTSKAIIEDCNGIAVSPYNFKYDGLDKDFVASTLDLNVNNWNKLDDFNWLVYDVLSPNWKVLDEKSRIISWDNYINKV